MSLGADRTITVTRVDLYEQVWSKPVRTLAREYGISNVGLRKICQRLDVPRPGLGYWARLQHGQKPARLPLPPQKEGVPDRATIKPSAASGIRSLVPRSPVRAPAVLSAVSVPEKLASPHPAIRLLGQSLREVKPYHGALWLRGEDQTVIRVSPAGRDRVLRILDAFFKALESRGHRVTAERPVQARGRYALTVAIGGQEIAINLKERIGLRERPPKNGERRTWKEYEHIPSGDLTLRLGPRTGDAHRSWSDGRGKPLEDKLGAAVLGVEEVAQARVEEERRWEESRRRYREEERLRELVRLRAAHEEALGRDLAQMTATWRESRQLRAFLEAVEGSVPESQRHQGFSDWLGWARGYVAARDPLRHPERIAKVLQPREPDSGPTR